MTHLTCFPCSLARRAPRRGVGAPHVERNAASGQGKPAFGGSQRPAARCVAIGQGPQRTRRAAGTHQMGHYQRSLV